MMSSRFALLISLAFCLAIPACDGRREGGSAWGVQGRFYREELNDLSRSAQAWQREEFAKITIRLRGGIALGNLRIAPVKVELRRVSGVTVSGIDRSRRKFQTEEPVLVLTFQVQNVATDEKQIFEPLARAAGKDNINHQLDDLTKRYGAYRLDGDQQHEELKPGERATILVCLKPTSEKATSYRWLIHAKVRNAPVDAWEKWCLEFDASEIETP